MTSVAAGEAALAALRYWATLGRSSAPELPVAWRELVRQTAWLTGGANPARNPEWPQPLAAPLGSIFSRVDPGDGPPPVFGRRARLSFDPAALFSGADPTAGCQPHGDDPLAAASVCLEQRRLATPAQIEGLLAAFQRYAWSLPSPLEAVSLADFACVHAALAAALALAGGDLFLLGGDLTGGQRFVAAGAAAGATRQMRGRALFVQLLTEVCAMALLRRAGLPLANLLALNGGRFLLLLPGEIAGAPAATWLATMRADFDRFLLDRYTDALALTLGGCPLALDNLTRADPAQSRATFSAVWADAALALATASARRWADLPPADLVAVFAPQGRGGSPARVCAICGVEDDALAAASDDGQGPRCRRCAEFDELGRMLPDARYLLLDHLAHPPPQRDRQSWSDDLAELGVQVRLWGDQGCLHPGAGPPAAAVEWTTVRTLDTAAPQAATPGAPFLPTGAWVCGYRPIAGAALAAEGDGERLGVLRMRLADLDDLLHDRFDGGLAQVAALSGAITRFFAGQIAALSGADARRIAGIHSDGADLLMIGAWRLLPHLARRISADLAVYTGNHAAIQLTAGISLHPAGLSLAQTVRAAEGELRRAREWAGKAALGWLGQAVVWSGFDDLAATQQQLVSAIRRRRAPPALLATCQQLYSQYSETLRQGKLFYGPWFWRGVHQFARLETHPAIDAPARAMIRAIRARLLEGIAQPPHQGARYIERLGLAARWAQLELHEERAGGDG